MELAKLEQQKDQMEEPEYARKVRALSLQGIQREQSDLRFTLDFVQDLISDAQYMDIDIFSERSKAADRDSDGAKGEEASNQIDSKATNEPKFDVEGLKADLEAYSKFKTEFMELLSELEKEIFGRQTHQALLDAKKRGLLDKFYRMRADITKQPIYERRAYRRIQAFVWMFNAYELLDTGEIDEDSPFHVQGDQRRGAKPPNSDETNRYMSIKQWRDFIEHHRSFLSIFPELAEHSAVQQLQWEVKCASRLIEDIKDQRRAIQNRTHLYTRGLEYYKNLPGYQVNGTFINEQHA